MATNYNKRPAIKINGLIKTGWEDIIETLKEQIGDSGVLVVDCYTGVHYEKLRGFFMRIPDTIFIDTASLFKHEVEIHKMTEGFMTDDVLFGYLSNLSMKDYFDADKLHDATEKIKARHGKVIVFGYGASLVADGDLVVYADMPRWEIQQRMRRKEVGALGINNREEDTSLQYKRGLFNDWHVCDKHKRTLYEKVNYWLDTVTDEPKLIDKETFFAGLNKAATMPFRVVPFFDPAPWGGQWMKEVCDLDRSKINFGWCFDCVPEENSLLLKVDGIEFEMPAVNLVYVKSKELLGEPVESRFGKEFPIRFDLLDTMGGGNLSLQVHPTTQYVHDHFGIPYTQDESYYLLDAGDGPTVYLGTKTGIDKNEMIADLEKAQQDDTFVFDAEKYINVFPAKKHDHYLIPAGTIHCSGKNTVVLEISATPNLFTLKLWDWQRMGLDGKPRPNNVQRGKEVIEWERDTEYVNAELANKFTVVNSCPGWVEEKTGLHKNQFIETRRHSFTKTVKHTTNGSVNVLNLVEGEEIMIESVNGTFEPVIIHYAETFIIPASVGEYFITPHGPSAGKECKTIKAYVRF